MLPNEVSEEWNGDVSLHDAEEKRVLFAALDSFRQYRKAAHYNVTHRRRQNFYALPTSHWQLLASPPFNVLSTLDRVDDAIDANGEIASQISATGFHAFGPSDLMARPEEQWYGAARPSDLDKARSTIRQFFRDWSDGGEAERAACYSPVLEDLAWLFSHAADKTDIRVLVPGAGLGRLVFEICKEGYCVEGNEISYHQLLASDWILNHVQPSQQFDLYPFALNFSNHVDRAQQLKLVKIPDVHPATELAKASVNRGIHAFDRMTMTAADFVMLYGGEEHGGTFDAVVTVFFIDTAPNVIRYIETIHKCLQAGAVWINLGPLLWHFEERGPTDESEKNTLEREKTRRINVKQEGIGEPGSVELSNEELLTLVQHMGFNIEKHELKSDMSGSGYIEDPESMLQNRYTLSHWIARKVS